MARRAIPMIAFHGVYCIYIYICMFVSLTRLCVVYVVKEVTSFPGAEPIKKHAYLLRNPVAMETCASSCLPLSYTW